MFLLAACCSLLLNWVCTAPGLACCGRHSQRGAADWLTGAQSAPTGFVLALTLALSGEIQEHFTPETPSDAQLSLERQPRIQASGCCRKGVRQMAFYMKRNLPFPRLSRSLLRHFCFPSQHISICFLNKQAGKSTQTLYASHGLIT